jgi:hypothetical protein
MLKHDMKDREFQNQQAVLNAIGKRWADISFAEVHRVFQELMEHLPWAVGNNSEHYPNERHQFRKWFTV